METEVIYQELYNARYQPKRGENLSLEAKARLLRRIAWLYRLFIASTRETTFYP